MFDFEKPNISIQDISEDGNFARFVCEPLERGYGTTLGNSLRRIMLSTLNGYAVSQIKIEGVVHEFSTIQGIKEDVTEIIMNIKSLAIKSNNDIYEVKTATIDFTGEGIVHASDIKMDPDLEIVNKDLVIAHLSDKNSSLKMELVITPGRGYVSADKNKENTSNYGTEFIAVDSIYQPCERVNMKIENTRVGNQTDFDKLTLEVTTNGTISAKDAVSLAAKVLSEHVKLFIDLSEKAQNISVINPDKVDDKSGKVLDQQIGELELSQRSYNCLKRAGVNTVRELCDMTQEQLANIRNLGKKCLDEIYLKLTEKNLKLKSSEEIPVGEVEGMQNDDDDDMD